MSTREKTRGMLGILLATVLFSSNGVLVKWIPGHPLAISGLRSLLAIPVLLLFLRKPRFTWSGVQVGAALAYAGMVIGFVTATRLTTAANAVVLQYSSPIYVALLSGWMLNERMSRLDWLTIVCVLGGVLLFFLDRLSPSGLAGNLIALGSGLSSALLLIFLRKQKHGSPAESIVLGNIIAAAVGLPFMVTAFPPRSAWPGILMLGVFQLGIAYVIYTRAIKKVTALEAVVIKGLEPILNPLLVYLFIGERPGPWALCGAAIVFSAVSVRSVLSSVGMRTGRNGSVRRGKSNLP